MSKLKQALQFDPLDAAEKLTGGSIHDGHDSPTAALGMLMFLSHNQKKEQLLREAQDSHFGISLADFITLAEAEGFRIVLDEEFIGQSYERTPITERFIIMWNDEGFLLKMESYQGVRIDTVNVLYNVVWNPDADGRTVWDACKGSSSPIMEGDPRTGVCIGRACDFDAREGFRHNLNEIRSNPHVTILPKWKARPFMWFLTYMDSKVKGYDRKAITEARIAKLPAHVREAITP